MSKLMSITLRKFRDFCEKSPDWPTDRGGSNPSEMKEARDIFL